MDEGRLAAMVCLHVRRRRSLCAPSSGLRPATTLPDRGVAGGQPMSSEADGSPGNATTSTGAQPTSEERAAAAAMLRMIGGVHVSQAVYVAAELGLADLLAAGPMTAGQLAAATETQ